MCYTISSFRQIISSTFKMSCYCFSYFFNSFYFYSTYTIFCIVYFQVKCRHSIISRFISNFWIIVCFIFPCCIFSCYCIFIACSISFNFKWPYLKFITIFNHIYIFIIILFLKLERTIFHLWSTYFFLF